MDDHHTVNGDAAYLVSGVLLDDEPVGPLYATAAEAHRIARTAIAGVGGTVRILRDGPAGWIEVARYTDTGQYATSRRSGLAARVVVADED
ncbi:hypothetical protein ACFFX1_55550 [Dactylosporangium sucinum]|uniref:Uncharacterized protein n=1 Tax=Dactylosporangium sucinum TaxID=1424081 RepID=A0A917U289_9ACTN|nr:hypothetical protein [Dactylosporangium sucinum]GGM52511.1 hypothetical protein GCM10007977_062540 [Dactylosporangium sucinum]